MHQKGPEVSKNYISSTTIEHWGRDRLLPSSAQSHRQDPVCMDMQSLSEVAMGLDHAEQKQPMVMLRPFSNVQSQQRVRTGRPQVPHQESVCSDLGIDAMSVSGLQSSTWHTGQNQ